VQIIKSFPSGHATFGAYSAVFFAWYLHCKLRHLKRQHLLSIVKVLVILYGFYTGISRISDNKHFWWDTSAGFLLGFSVAIYAVIFSIDFYYHFIIFHFLVHFLV
jgi:phosphatidate phosphatase